jgi:hypothetical protein
MTEALPGLQRVHGLAVVDEIHGPRVDEVHAVGRLPVLYEDRRSRRHFHQLGRLSGGPPLPLINSVEWRLVRQEVRVFVGGVQDSVTR